MQWKRFKLLVKQIWLTQAHRALQTLAQQGMLLHGYQRQWEEHPWVFTESVRFRCVSDASGLYLVEKVLSRQHLLDGKLKTEVTERTEWKAAYHSSCHLLVEIGGYRQVCFVAESSQMIVGNDVFNVKD